MAKRWLAALFLFVTMVVVLPPVALAAPGDASTGGLVPCGVGSGPDVATECQACNLVQLSQNVVMFLIGLSIPVAIALFAWAGILYFTSGMGGSENISKAKTIFRSAVFGFVLAVGAWLIVNTLLYTILDHDQYPNSSWFKIDCSVNRQITGNIQDVLTSTLGAAPTPVTLQTPPDFTVSYGCATGSYNASLGLCVDGTGQVVGAPTPVYANLGGGTLNQDQLNAALNGTYGYQAQLQAICVQQGLTNCKLAQAIMAIESNGSAAVVSGAGAVGLMQIMPTTACSLNSSISGCSSCLAGGSCSTVAQQLTNPTLNMTLGVQYINQLSSQFSTIEDVVAGYNGGAGANKPSVTCPGQTYWACIANDGYAETRNYVPNVLNTLTLIK